MVARSIRSAAGTSPAGGPADFEIRGLDTQSGVVYISDTGLDGERDVRSPCCG